MKKRILSILLLCCMVLTLLPTTAFAAGELPDVKLSVPTTFDKTVDLTEQNKELKIKDSKTYLIKGSADPNWSFQYRIKIEGKNNTPHIFLDGVRLQAPEDGPAIELYGGASACLYFIGGDSELIGAENFAALQKNKTDGYLRVLVQTGTKLTCEGGRYGAGIGGSKVGIKKFSQGHGMNLHFGSLATDIYGGEILATSGAFGAGIGGGQGGGVGEWIYVYSGKLTVRSVSQGAGIGGGQGGVGRYIYIKGGTVNAGSSTCGAGIGSGDQDGQNKSEDAYHIEISGGTVNAWSNYAGAGIGGGRNGSGRDISITGGNVNAQGWWGAGIGGGMNGDSGNILIKDTTLTAQSLPLYPNPQYEDATISGGPAVAVGRGSNRLGWTSVLFKPKFGLLHEENVKIGASDGKTVQLSATGWQWRRSQGEYEWNWGITTELLIPNEYGRVDLQRLSLPYACNYGRVIGKLELRCYESTCSHELGWTDRDGCHIWACVKCGARDPAAEMSKQNAKHIPGDWGNQKQLCTVCGHVMGTDTKAPVLEGLKDGESYTVEDTLDGNPGAYTFTVSDPAASGETSSGIKSVTINGEPQAGPTYRLPAPDGGNNDAGAEYTVVATDNAGNETTATVRTYRRHHVKVISPDGNGTASASPDKAVAGTEITLTATPKEDYRFKEWQVVSPAGLVITNNKFTMPDSNVEVKAIFEEDAPAPTAPAKPSIRVTGAYTYNGSEHTATVIGYDSATMDITGNTATDAGDYTVSVTSQTGKWADGSTDAVTAAWSIGKATQEAPTGLIGVAPTTVGGSDGKINGVTDKMEYRMAGESSYTACSGTEIDNLSAGNYFVRYAEDNNHFASSDAAVTVGEGTPLADCTITFNAGGGSGSMDSVTVKAGTNYTLPACGFTAPANQQFKAWEIGGMEYPVNAPVTVTADITVEALWEDAPPSHEHSYGDWSKDGTSHWHECTDDDCPKKPESIKDKAAHVYTDDADTTCNVCGYERTVTPPAPTEFIVTFDAGDGTPSVGSMTTTNQKLSSLPSASRSKHSFDGWYTEKSGGTKVTTDTVFHAKTTVYAHWTYTGGGYYYPPVTYYTLCFETGGGSDISSVQGTYNAYIDLTQYVPTWRGHTFTGWYSERSLKNKVSGVYLTKDMTVYAGWRVTTVPQTGDSSVLGLWGISLCTSLAGCLALTTWQIRRRREEESLQIIEK